MLTHGYFHLLTLNRPHWTMNPYRIINTRKHGGYHKRTLCRHELKVLPAYDICLLYFTTCATLTQITALTYHFTIESNVYKDNMYIDIFLYQSGLLITEKTETFVWVTQKIVTPDNWEMYG